MKTKAKITRKDTREHLAQFHLACELVKVIHHYFSGLLSLLKRLEDPRGQRYITYESHVLLMTRILSSIFYISSMRKTSQEFNSAALTSKFIFSGIIPVSSCIFNAFSPFRLYKGTQSPWDFPLLSCCSTGSQLTSLRPTPLSKTYLEPLFFFLHSFF